MKPYYSLYCLIFLLISGCAEDNKIGDKRLNSLPKRVKMYHFMSTASDSLWVEYAFYRNAASQSLDSFSVSFPGADMEMHIFDQSAGYYQQRIGNDYVPSYAFYHSSSDSRMDNFSAGLFMCDGTLPGHSYDFLFNSEGAIQSYSRNIVSARCDGRSNDALMEYRNDTLLVKNIKDAGYVMDTIVYRSNDLHYSNLPVFSFMYGRMKTDFQFNLFNLGYPVLFTPLSPYPYQLIDKIISDGFESRYVYTFDDNDNVVRLDIFTSEKINTIDDFRLEYHNKFEFEY